MKYTPTRAPLTTELVRQKEYGWAILSGLMEVAIAVDNKNQGLDYLSCGNSSCIAPIKLTKGQPLPKICVKCGSEVDWVGIKTKIIRECPQCKHLGAPEDVYCPNHSPAIRLADKEVPH